MSKVSLKNSLQFVGGYGMIYNRDILIMTVKSIILAPLQERGQRPKGGKEA